MNTYIEIIKETQGLCIAFRGRKKTNTKMWCFTVGTQFCTTREDVFFRYYCHTFTNTTLLFKMTPFKHP